MAANEAQTRALQIDPQLRTADWKLNNRTQVRLEVPVDGYDAEPWNGVTDYCLYDASGNVLAVVEAKRCSRNAREADEQLRYYVTEIAKKQPFAPFGFMANGHDIWFWEVSLANPRLVARFFTPPDLERLKFLRQNRRPLETIPIRECRGDAPNPEAQRPWIIPVTIWFDRTFANKLAHLAKKLLKSSAFWFSTASMLALGAKWRTKRESLLEVHSRLASQQEAGKLSLERVRRWK
jgi:hypothetical protein